MKKKIVTMALVCLTLAISLSCSAKDFQIDGKVLFMYKGNAENVAIPKGVTAIGNGAFSTRTSLISVTIPSSVTSIGINTFYECSNLTRIT